MRVFSRSVTPFITLRRRSRAASISRVNMRRARPLPCQSSATTIANSQVCSSGSVV